MGSGTALSHCDRVIESVLYIVLPIIRFCKHLAIWEMYTRQR